MNLLLASILVPLLGAVAAWSCGRCCAQLARQIALVVSLATLALAGLVVLAGPGPQTAWEGPLLASSDLIRVQFSLGLDGLSLWLYGLSALLVLSSVLVSWQAISERPGLFYGLLLLLEAGMLGVFAAQDVLVFYIFFEFTLIPLFFLIGIWGSEERRYAAVKFFLFTLAGSVLTFLGLLSLVLWNFAHAPPGSSLTFSIPALTAGLAAHPVEPLSLQVALFLALFAGFAIKVPLFPLHTWLPLAHVQAPTAGSVLLAGVLLKIGTYGFLRFSIPMLPEAAAYCAPWLLGLSVAGILYGALVALAQKDIKRLIAYSSVSHLGFCMLGLFALNPLGVEGATLQMINHGLSTGGLFALVGMLYERYHTREIAQLSGLAREVPLLSSAFVLFTFSSIGLPGLNGFAGEFLILCGMFQRAFGGAPAAWAACWQILCVLSVFGVVLGAWYMLYLVQRICFGRLKSPAHEGHAPPDMSLREFAALAPLAVFVFWIGLVPQHFLRPMHDDLERARAGATAALDEVWGPAPPLVSTDGAPVAARLTGGTARVE